MKEQQPDPAALFDQGRRQLAEQLTEVLTAAIEADLRVADDEVKSLKSPVAKRLRQDAERVADRFDSLTGEADAALLLAREERKELRRLHAQLVEDLSRHA